ncbi:hypothetical protein LEP1GSC120_2810 [Leptospira santarosai str. 200702252]|nr:hypothetical protein LEP1GSC120_2810 [Leptospira santarosai str. 200702252]
MVTSQEGLSLVQTRRIAAKEVYSRRSAWSTVAFVIASAGTRDSKLLFPNLKNLEY